MKSRGGNGQPSPKNVRGLLSALWGAGIVNFQPVTGDRIQPLYRET